MSTTPSHRCRFRRAMQWLKSRLAGESGGSQLVEFAISLPFLVFFSVGIFDFGSAYTVKEKLAGIAQEAARVGASQPERDLTYSSGDCTQLVAVCAVRDVVDHGLVSAKMDDCGLASTAPGNRASQAGYGSMTWQFQTSGGCPGNLVLIVGRGYTYSANLTRPFSDQTVEATKITLKYPYRWQFGKVVSLVAPGLTFGGASQITSTAVVQNLY